MLGTEGTLSLGGCSLYTSCKTVHANVSFDLLQCNQWQLNTATCSHFFIDFIVSNWPLPDVKGHAWPGLPVSLFGVNCHIFLTAGCYIAVVPDIFLLMFEKYEKLCIELWCYFKN